MLSGVMVTARRRLGTAMASVLVMALLGGNAASAELRRPRPKLSGTVTVSAASSLTEAFTEIGAKFEKANRAAHITFNFGSSSTLELQIEQGAPADVFASADLTNMDKLLAAGKVASPAILARNQLEIAVKPANPQHVRSIADLANVGVVALCAEAVPCGKYANQILARAGVKIPPDRITRGQDVKATLTAVSAGDADAAIVYVTDVRAAKSSVEGVSIPEAHNTVAVYPIATLIGGSHLKLAKAFVAYVRSSAAQRILERHGFLAP